MNSFVGSSELPCLAFSFVSGSTCAFDVELFSVELLCCKVVMSLGFKPTDFSDFLVRDCGALAQSRWVYE